MTDQRPKLKIPLEPVDWWLEITAMILILFCMTVTFIFWRRLPQMIPTHFNLAGQADSFGNKTTLFFLLPFLLVIYFVFTLLGKFPNTYNYVVKITEENAERQYRLASRLMRVIKTEIIAIFTFIQTAILSAVKSGTFTLGIAFVPIMMIILLGTIGYYMAASIKAK